MSRVVIVGAKRTLQGRFLGGLAKRSAVDLACVAGTAALQQIEPAKIDMVIMGNVLSAGQGMNIGRQIGVILGVPIASPSFTVNMMCASGMKAVMLAADAIRSGEANVVLCGGTESMSNAPYLLERARGGLKFGNSSIIDSILRDGLVDSFDHQHMGQTAERLAHEYGITRLEQDAFALQSQGRYSVANIAGKLARETVAVDDLFSDEHPRPQITAAELSMLKPSFDPQGTVTAGNSSGINDGAAMLVLANECVARSYGWKPLATIDAYTSEGCDPKLMGLGPVYAIRKLSKKTNLSVDDYDAIELNEAFAAQALACIAELKLDRSKVNACGGAIAIGHPIGATGARILVHLAHRIADGEIRRALATLCVGGGMGTAMSLSTF